MRTLTDLERLEAARVFAEQVSRREVPGAALLTDDARMEGSIFGAAIGVAPMPLRDRLLRLSAADEAYGLAFRECFAAPHEQVVVVGVARRPSTVELVAVVCGFRGSRVMRVEAFDRPAAAFERVGLTYPPAADVERLAARPS